MVYFNVFLFLIVILYVYVYIEINWVVFVFKRYVYDSNLGLYSK